MSAGKILTIDEYFSVVPEARTSNPHAYLPHRQVSMSAAAAQGRLEIIEMGMLRWNDETAYQWSAPYPGNYVIIEATKDLHPPGLADGTGKSFREIARRISSEERWWSGDDRESVKQFHSIILAAKNDDYHEAYQFLINLPDGCRLKDRIERDYGLFHKMNSYTSREYPYLLYIRGTDDCSYSKTFPDREQLLTFLEEIVEMYSVYPHEDGLAAIGMEFSN